MFETYFDAVREAAEEPSERAIFADQLLVLHEAARSKPDVVFLELGTDRGQSTKMILHALAGTRGRLVSVDIRDCSDAGAGDNWTFIQADSADVAAILSKAPFLKQGIDFIYVDSLHTPEHVLKELYGFFKYVRKGGKIFFDDIDSTPYMRGRRKDSYRAEMRNREIFGVIKDVFYDNLDCLRLEAKFGSTGLAILTKTAEFGAELRPYRPLPKERRFAAFYRLIRKFKKRYKNLGDGSDMLIPMD